MKEQTKVQRWKRFTRTCVLNIWAQQKEKLKKALLNGFVLSKEIISVFASEILAKKYHFFALVNLKNKTEPDRHK